VAGIVQAKSVTWGEARAYVNSHKWEADIVAMIRAWALAHPDELVALDRQMKAARREGAYRKAFGTTAKDMAHFGEIPILLYKAMCRAFPKDREGRNWLQQQEIAEAFFRHFRVGVLNLRSMPDFEK
jgi:hypothetical protein